MILGIFISTALTVFGDENSTSQNGMSITYGKQKWTENQYCEFPKRSISADNGSIEFSGNIHYNFKIWNNGEPNNGGKSNTEMYLSTLRGSVNLNNLSENGSLDTNENPSYIPQVYTIEYVDRLYGNSESLEGSAIATVRIGKPVALKYNVNNSQGATQNYPDETVHYDQEFSYDINSFPVSVAPNYKIKGWYTKTSGGNKVELSSNIAEAIGN